MTDKENKPLPELLREQLNLQPCNRDSSLLEQAATKLEDLQGNVTYYGEQLMYLRKTVAELKQKLKVKHYN